MKVADLLAGLQTEAGNAGLAHTLLMSMVPAKYRDMEISLGADTRRRKLGVFLGGRLAVEIDAGELNDYDGSNLAGTCSRENPTDGAGNPAGDAHLAGKNPAGTRPNGGTEPDSRND